MDLSYGYPTSAVEAALAAGYHSNTSTDEFDQTGYSAKTGAGFLPSMKTVKGLVKGGYQVADKLGLVDAAKDAALDMAKAKLGMGDAMIAGGQGPSKRQRFGTSGKGWAKVQA